ncbi:MAG: hypothetical protein RRZ85_06285 [Gordonibacter sp.]
MCNFDCERVFEALLDAMAWLPTPAWDVWATVCDVLTDALHVLLGM